MCYSYTGLELVLLVDNTIKIINTQTFKNSLEHEIKFDTKYVNDILISPNMQQLMLY